MKKTTNLGLNIITESASDKSMLFSEWRKLIAGDVENSNMNVIDGALGDCVNRLAHLIREGDDGLIIDLTSSTGNT